MTTSHLLQNASGSWTRNTPGSAWHVGSRFRCTEEASVSGLGWYRNQTGGDEVPNVLRLWDMTDTSEPVWESITVDDDTAVGWQWTPIEPNIELVVGRLYMVSGDWDANQGQVYRTSGWGTPPAPFDSAEIGSRWTANPYALTVPNYSEQPIQNAVSVRVETPPTTPAPWVTETTLDIGLNRWLGTTPDRPEGNPGGWIGDSLAGVAVDIGASGVSIASRVGPLQTYFGISDQGISAGVKGVADRVDALDDVVGPSTPLPPGAPTLSGTLALIYADITGLAVEIGALELSLQAAQAESAWSSGAVLAPAAHTLADTFPFTGQVGWSPGQPLYHVTVESWPAGQGQIDLGAAGTWLPRLGWWAPVLADGSIGDRRYLEFAAMWLWPVPRTTVGVVLFVHPATAGTLRAYEVA